MRDSVQRLVGTGHKDVIYLVGATRSSLKKNSTVEYSRKYCSRVKCLKAALHLSVFGVLHRTQSVYCKGESKVSQPGKRQRRQDQRMVKEFHVATVVLLHFCLVEEKLNLLTNRFAHKSVCKYVNIR